jgi:5'-nucleotidase / UDP-sugar diphosphatase
MADGLLYAAERERAAEFGVPEADIALQNGGGMRQEQIIQPGPVTELDTFDIAAFANFVSVAEVTGTELKSALERSVSAQPGAAGFHGQWAGVKFNFDTSRQAQTVDFLTQQITQEGERIWDAVVTKADGSTVTLVEDGVLVAPDEAFTMASISFIFDGGGDGYFALDLPYTTLGFTYQQALYNRFVGPRHGHRRRLPGRLREHQRLHPLRSQRPRSPSTDPRSGKRTPRGPHPRGCGPRRV